MRDFKADGRTTQIDWKMFMPHTVYVTSKKCLHNRYNSDLKQKALILLKGIKE